MKSLSFQTIILTACLCTTTAFNSPSTVNERRVPTCRILTRLHPVYRQRIFSSESSSSVLESSAASSGSSESSSPSPKTFREAEVLGLRLMQDGRHEDALRGECAYVNPYAVKGETKAVYDPKGF